MDFSRIEEYIRQQTHALRGAAHAHVGERDACGSSSSSSSSDSAPMDTAQIDQLRRLSDRWTDATENIKRMKRMIFMYTNMKKDYEEQMIEIMQRNDLDVLNHKDGVIQTVVKQRKKRVTKDQMKRDIEGLVPDAEVRKAVLSYVLNEQPALTEPKTALKRIQY